MIAGIALGGNVEPEQRLAQAARLLTQRFPGIRFSHCYRNPAVGFVGADFINAAACFHTDLSPPALVAALHVIEEQCGRLRDDPKWAPRAMDLDLLLYGDRVQEADPVLPRRDLLKRVFMLGPMAQIMPAWSHPLAHRTLAELWRDVPAGQRAALAAIDLDLNATV
ncbi:MAG: 2-amino-4-hydroxy-6-hydroxymethyldihydropteridine diphosphokinase [Steroidobacteraceae bacterium]